MAEAAGTMSLRGSTKAVAGGFLEFVRRGKEVAIEGFIKFGVIERGDDERERRDAILSTK